MFKHDNTITADRIRQLISYDPETGIFHWLVSGYKRKIGKIAGSPDANGYWRITIDYKRYLAHRLAWFYTHGRWPTAQIDHHNLHRDDNRLANLREATQQQNCANSRPRHTHLLPKGVYKNRNRYQAMIRITGKTIHLGSFADPVSAHAAYVAAAQKLHGAFARGT